MNYLKMLQYLSKASEIAERSLGGGREGVSGRSLARGCVTAQVSPSDQQYLPTGVKAPAKRRMGHGVALARAAACERASGSHRKCGS